MWSGIERPKVNHPAAFLTLEYFSRIYNVVALNLAANEAVVANYYIKWAENDGDDYVPIASVKERTFEWPSVILPFLQQILWT